MGDLMPLSYRLSGRLCRQRAKFLETCIQSLREASQEKIIDNFDPNWKAAAEVVSAFQAVHVLSFINMHSYVNPASIGEFTRLLCDHLFEGDQETCLKYTERYTELKKQEFCEQLVTFVEDAIMALMGSSVGLIYGAGFALTAHEFLYRNWGITADLFGDRTTVEKIANVIKKHHAKDS